MQPSSKSMFDIHPMISFTYYLIKYKFLCNLQVNGIYIVKSGSDFRQFSTISLDFRESPVSVEIECVDVTKEVEPDAELEKCLEEFTGKERGEREFSIISYL